MKKPTITSKVLIRQTVCENLVKTQQFRHELLSLIIYKNTQKTQ